MESARCASALGLFLATPTLTGCSGTLYGASFDYPSAPPVPIEATVLVTDKGWDDDDPIRLRVQVVDPGEARDDLLDFYRDTYPESDGWEAVEPRGRRYLLCLVNRTNDEYDQVLAVTPYDGSRVADRPGRLVVTVSRSDYTPKRPCGVAMPWTPMDIL